MARFNSLAREEAEQRLYACFASPPWAARVAAQRPFDDLGAILAAAALAWAELESADWLAAFAAHPRIGESGGHSPASSEREQSRVASAPGHVLAALAEENRRYEQRFGHVFLISASGRSAEEILAALRERMRNDPVTEVQMAAEEHRKITRLRLEAMLRA